MAQPVFYLLAGPDGAGKSTLYKALVQGGTIPVAAEFVNADLHEGEHLQHITDPQARVDVARLWANAAFRPGPPLYIVIQQTQTP